jgi:hypothetical protein
MIEAITLQNITLRRYLTFERFLKTLEQGLFVPNASLFDDRWEAMVHQMDPYLQEKKAVILLKDEGVKNPTLDEFCIPEIYRQVRDGMKEVCVSCWNGTIYECVAMWELYGKGENGVMIETNAYDLIAAFESFNSSQNSEWHACFKNLMYILPGENSIPTGYEPLWSNLEKIDANQLQVTFRFQQVFTGLQYKHKSYEFEKEYRLLVAHKNRGKSMDGIILPLKETFIERVILQPDSSDNFKAVVQDCLTKRGFVDSRVEKSIIDELPRYD